MHVAVGATVHEHPGAEAQLDEEVWEVQAVAVPLHAAGEVTVHAQPGWAAQVLELVWLLQE